MLKWTWCFFLTVVHFEGYYHFPAISSRLLRRMSLWKKILKLIKKRSRIWKEWACPFSAEKSKIPAALKLAPEIFTLFVCSKRNIEVMSKERFETIRSIRSMRSSQSTNPTIRIQSHLLKPYTQPHRSLHHLNLADNLCHFPNLELPSWSYDLHSTKVFFLFYD